MLADRFSVLVGNSRPVAVEASPPVARGQLQATSDGSVGAYTPKASR